MNLSRPHPANGLAWLHVSPEQYARAFQEQQRLVKEHLAKDPQFSGQPPEFDAWGRDHVRELAHDRSVAAQVEARRVALDREITQLQRELEDAATAFARQIETRTAELAFLATLPSLATICGTTDG